MKKSTKILIYGLLGSISFIASCLYIENRAFIEKQMEENSKDKKEISINSRLDKNGSNYNETGDPSFLDYKIDKGVISIVGEMPLLGSHDSLKKSINRLCGVLHCERSISFSPNVQIPAWKDFAIKIIDLFYEESLSYANFSVDKNNRITIGGEFSTEESKERLTNLLKKYQQYDIKDNTNLKVLKLKISKDKVEQNTTNINITKKSVIEIKDKIETVQEEIINILKNKKINFIRNRAKITQKGIETLNEIVVILKKVPDAKIEVRGYTDASGKRSINKWISMERAKSVRNYLGSRGINPVNIEAKGFGEEGLLYEDKPYSELNRRVEIGIKRR
jgi:outer membrane protein OmpA-like peptidoglycan-associated protein